MPKNFTRLASGHFGKPGGALFFKRLLESKREKPPPPGRRQSDGRGLLLPEKTGTTGRPRQAHFYQA
jgi:hypothetical protein